MVSYADGVFDSRFNRFITVREGRSLIYITIYYFSWSFWFICKKKKMLSLTIFLTFLLYVDRRQSSINATTDIVTVRLGSDDIQGENCEVVFSIFFYSMGLSFSLSGSIAFDCYSNL